METTKTALTKEEILSAGFLSSLFDTIFKFRATQPVRHKGDNKGHSDMGLLVLHRYIAENVSDDYVRTFERHYVCRSIAYSGSGELFRFQERELMSMEEYRQAQLEEENRVKEMYEDSENLRRDVFAAFGITNKNAIVTLKSHPDIEFRVSGFHSDKKTELAEGEKRKFLILLTAKGGLETGREKVEVRSKDEIESVNNDPSRDY